MLSKYFTILLIISFLIPINAQQTKVHDSLLTIYKSTQLDTVKARLLNSLYWEVAYSDLELSKTYAEDLIILAEQNNLKKSLGRGYNNLAGYFEINTVNDSARYYLEKANIIFKALDEKELLYRTNRSFALIDYTEGKLEEALERTKQNLALKEKLNDSSGIAREYNFMGGLYYELGKIKLANEYKLNALKIYNQIDDETGKADTLLALGTLYLEDSNYDKYVDYASQALEIYKKQNDKFYQSLCLYHLGQGNNSLKKYEIALNYLKEGYDIALELKSNRLLSMLSLDLGQTYLILKDEKNSDNYLNKALEYADPLNNKLHYIKILKAIAGSHINKNQANQALIKTNEALELLDSVQSLNLKSSVYEIRSESYEMLGNYKMALSDYKVAKSLQDSIFSKEKTKQIEELRTIYETEKKEQQIQIQKNEIDLLNVKGRVSNLQRLLLGLGLLLALIAVYAFYQKNKRNKLGKENAQAKLEFKTKELTTHALHLAKKNEVLNDLKQKAKVLKQDANADPGYQMLIQTINFDLQDDNNWENFSRYFEEVHKDFNTKAQQKFPAITANDLRLMSLMKMNLSAKEIANILNISSDGIKKARQRLRKKMGLDSNDSLEAVVIAI